MRRILLLNSSYEPDSFVDEKKAISLILRSAVDVVASWEDVTLIPRFNRDGSPLFMPATMRLCKWHNKKSRMPKFRRSVVFTRDNYRCAYCDTSLSFREATIDHILPKHQGGETVWKNTITACRPCNRFKANRTPEQADMRLLKQPTVPSVVHFWDARQFGNVSYWHESWDMFIPK